MTPHMHQVLTPGCYRCELSRDEAATAEQEATEQAEREANCPAHEWRQRTTRFETWAECSQCGAEDVVDAPLEETMRVAREQMAKWKKTLDWLAER